MYKIVRIFVNTGSRLKGNCSAPRTEAYSASRTRLFCAQGRNLVTACGRQLTKTGRVTFAPKTVAVAQRRHFAMTADKKKPFERLPVDVEPVNYKLRLQPNLTAFTFQGSSDISVQVSSEWPALAADA